MEQTEQPLTIAYIGNFEPEHSTENHVRQAAERVGHTVVPLQENTRETWAELQALERGGSVPDVVLWTRTGWDWPACAGWTWEEATGQQAAAMEHLAALGIPTIGFHLDRWWGLDRTGQIYDEPFFRVDLLCTADGGHVLCWAEADVNHFWLPPGVLLAECEREPRPNFKCEPVIWMGSWQHYHAEWLPYRRQLIRTVKGRHRNRFGLYPRRQGIRGQGLTDLYATAKVVVGDSCLAGGITHYWSDRIPETLGRGGVLVHPAVVGIEGHYTPGEHLLTYELDDWDGLLEQIDWALTNPAEADEMRAAGREHVMAHHTYEVRIEQALAEARHQDLLR